MVYVFALIVSINNAVDNEKTSYWYSLYDCKEHARELNHQAGINITAYCVPVWIEKNDRIIY